MIILFPRRNLVKGLLPVLFFSIFRIGISETYAQNDCKSFAPEWISLGITASPATGQTVSWRSEKGSGNGKAQIVAEDPSPNLELNARTVESVSGQHSDYGVEKTYHRVMFSDLRPGTTYLYRVGNDSCWSEWFQFRTAEATASSFSFLYFGDVQYGIASLYPRVIRQAIMKAPESSLLMFVGDLTTNATNREFNDFFNAGGWILASKAVVPVPDGHEYPKDAAGNRMGLVAFWDRAFSFPANVPEPLAKAGNYSFDYQNTRFILFNTYDYGMGKAKLYLEWLESLLKNNPQKWTVVAHHQPAYPISERRNKTGFLDQVQPLYDRYGVDLVLSGHDHGYSRGGIGLRGNRKKKINGPVYVVSVSGPGMYTLAYRDWYDRVASDTQLFQHITMENDEISFKAYTATGRLYDRFTVRKKSGRKVFIDHARDISEYTEIPQSQKTRYPPERMQALEKQRETYLRRKWTSR